MNTETDHQNLYWIASFYRFAPLQNIEALKAKWTEHCLAHNIKGSILLAEEGLNSTISGQFEALKSTLELIQQSPEFKGLTIKYATAHAHPFQRFKVKIKREIVTFGQENINPAHKTGSYIAPQDWNALIQAEDVTVLDTRNDYEIDVGTFKGAINPQIDKFTDFVDYVRQDLSPEKNPKIAMFCTGGIRCEKASAWMLEEGYQEVYHLEGGILNYLEQVPEDQSLWEGSCFVFDERVAVDHQLNYGQLEMCWGCGRPLEESARLDKSYEKGVSCSHCIHQRSDSQKQRSRQAWTSIQNRLAF